MVFFGETNAHLKILEKWKKIYNNNLNLPLRGLNEDRNCEA